LRPWQVVALLLVALQAGAAAADTLHLWRFEDAPGFFAASQGTAALVGGATPVALPGSGRGSQFASLPGLPNASAADVLGANDLAAILDAPILGDFTAELLVHFDTLSGTFGSHLVGAADLGVTTGISWTLQVRYDGALGSLPGELVMAVVDASGALELVRSGIFPETGKDYFMATSFDLAGGEVVFHVQNLTDGGPLQTVTGTHTRTSLNPISVFGIGGFVSNNLLPTDGLIDEVRLSDAVLPVDALYVNSAIPEPGTGALVALGLGALGVRRRRREAR
jgi:hypothetical protein